MGMSVYLSIVGLSACPACLRLLSPLPSEYFLLEEFPAFISFFHGILNIEATSLPWLIKDGASMAYRDEGIEGAIMMWDNEQFLCCNNEVNKRKER